MTPARVVDTNVLLVANASSANASAKCVANCATLLARFYRDELQLVIDHGREIVREYGNKLTPRGPPTAGNVFLKWVLTNVANPRRCFSVTITPVDSDQGYNEFPEHPALAGFDNADRKFVAVANAHPDHPVIHQAMDSKWIGWREALADVGIIVKFECEAELQRVWDRKTGSRMK